MIDSIISAWWAWMFSMTLQISLVILIVAAVCFFYTKVSARFLYVLWLLIFIKLLIPPTIGHSYSISNIIRRWITPVQHVSLVISESASSSVGIQSMEAFRDTGIAEEGFNQSVGNAIRRTLSAISIKTIFFTIWMSIVFVLLARILYTGRRFRRWLMIHGREPSDDMRCMLRTVSMDIGLGTPPDCIMIAHQCSPCVFGWLRPRLVIPAALEEQLSTEQIQSILIHELLHIKRKDSIMNGLQSIIEVIYWFNPLVWLAGREIRNHREMSVDEEALSIGKNISRHAYEHAILNITENYKPLMRPALLGILEPSSFIFRRIVRLLHFRTPEGNLHLSLPNWCLLLMFLGFFLPLGFTQPSGTRETDVSKNVLNEEQQLYIAWTDSVFKSIYDVTKFDTMTDNEKRQEENRLLSVLRDPTTGDIYEAIQGLGIIQSKEAVQPLLNIAMNKLEGENRTRWMAVRSLGFIGDTSVVPRLIHLVYHYNQNTRIWAQISLVRLTGQNFGYNWVKWGEWWNNQGKQPQFSPQTIIWTQRAEFADPEKQQELDRTFFEKLKGESRSVPTSTDSDAEKNYLGQTNFPRVIELDPAHGAVDVDPNREYITVTYDKPMRSGYSWVDRGSRPPFDKIEWINERQCRAWVKLEPGREYGVWLNFGPRTCNFKSAEGVSAERIYWQFKTAGEASSSGVISSPGQQVVPKIVSITPANGARDVSPSLTEIRVTFDIGMASGFSWVGGGDNFPEVSSKPYWTEDRKTCVLPVTLKPSWTYSLGLNSPTYKNFRSVDGVALEPVEYSFSTALK